jgi:hypothetical protein
MEQQQTQTTASPEPRLPRGSERCRARNRDRSQCRNHVQDLATGLCGRHRLRTGDSHDELQDTTDLSKQLLVVNEGGYCSADSINAILSNVVELLAKGRISPRRASVITFALSLMLRSVIVQDRQIANPQINWGSCRPDPVQAEPASSARDSAEASAQTHPHTGHDAMENYARLRT